MEVALSVLGQLRNLEDARSVLRGLRELVALGSAGEASAADLSRLANAGAPQHLLLALERHIGNPEIQKVGCAALAVLAERWLQAGPRAREARSAAGGAIPSREQSRLDPTRKEHAFPQRQGAARGSDARSR